MDRYSLETRCFLDVLFDPEVLARCGYSYPSYQPLRGLDGADWTPGHFLMAARWVRLAHLLRRLQCRTVLDVGGAEGLVAWLMQRTCGVEAVSADLSVQAALRARQTLGMASLAAEAPRLPFADGAFDVVYCGEVIEHLAQPFAALLELARVARVAVVVTSEAAALDEDARTAELAARFFSEHMDRSMLCPGDVSLLLPDWTVHAGCQIAALPDPVPPGGAALAAVLTSTVQARDLVPPAQGLFAVALRRGAIPHPDASVAREVGAILAAMAPPGPAAATRDDGAVHDTGASRDIGAAAHGDAAHASSDASIPAVLRERLVCPLCRGALADGAAAMRCAPCARSYPVRDGVPDLVLPEDEGPVPPLEPRLRAAFGADATRVRAILDLDARLRFELPPPATGNTFLAEDLGAWNAGAGVTLAPRAGGGGIVTATMPDPALFSPRLDRPLAAHSAVRARVRTVSTSRGTGRTETAQLYCKTLRRPLWWEGAGVRVEYPADGAVHDIILPLPHAALPAGDELLALRFDPCDDPGVVEVLALELLAPGDPRAR